MITEDIDMLDEYDFSNSIKNPYINQIHKDFTVSVNLKLLEKLEKLSEEKGVSVQKIISRMLEQYTIGLDE